MKSLKYIVLTLAIVFASVAFSEEHEDGAGAQFGEGKAVVAFDKEQGFKLSSVAIKNLKIKFQKIEGKGPWTVPSGSLVHIKQSVGVYRSFESWISFVLVKIVKSNGNNSVISSEDLESGDEIAVSGTTFLRMTDADLNSETVDSCAH